MSNGRSSCHRGALREIGALLSRLATSFVRRRCGVVLGLLVIAAALTGMAPVSLKYAVDQLTDIHSSHSGLALVFVGLYAGALGFARIADELREFALAQAEQRMFRLLGEHVFGHLMKLPLRFHLDRKSGAVNQALDNGLQGFGIILHQAVFTCLPIALELMTGMVVIWKIIGMSVLILYCGAAGCCLIVFIRSGGAIGRAARRAAVARMEAAATMTDGLLNYETVKYFSAESLVQERVGAALRRAEEEWVRFYGGFARMGAVSAMVFAAFLGATVLYAARQVQGGRMSIGDFVLVNAYLMQVVRPVELLGYAIQAVSHGRGMLDALMGLLREPAEPGGGRGTARLPRSGAFEFRHVSVSYVQGRAVLTDVTFNVCSGRSVGIVGPSGSGKSTIVRLLTRLLEPDSGVVLLGGVSVADMELREVRESVAVVPQDTILFDESVRYNIAVGRPDAGLSEIEEAARIARLHDFVLTLPRQYDTAVGERGVKLSGGQRQRIAIARAVLKAPRIFIFDEATSSLDSSTEGELLGNMRSLSQSSTTVVIAHRLSSVMHADEILVLDQGRIIERGGHESLLCHGGKYAELWRAQQGHTLAA